MRTAYTRCPSCSGSGLGVDSYNGEPTHCFECKGDTVVRARDAKGRFTTVDNGTLEPEESP